MRDAKRFVQLEICLVRCKTRSDSQKKDKTHFPATKRPPSYSKSRQWVWLSCKKWVVGMVELQKSRQWVWLSCNCGYGIVGMIELQCKKVRKGIDQVYKRPPTIKTVTSVKDWYRSCVLHNMGKSDMQLLWHKFKAENDSIHVTCRTLAAQWWEVNPRYWCEFYFLLLFLNFLYFLLAFIMLLRLLWAAILHFLPLAFLHNYKFTKCKKNLFDQNNFQ